MFRVRTPLALLREYRMATLAVPSQSMFDAFGSTLTSSNENISVDGAMAIADVFAAVNIIASDVSMCPLKVFRNVGEDVLEQPEHRAFSMLHDKPNSYMPAHRFWATVAGHELLWGNWFLLKQRDLTSGLVVELHILPPALVTVEWNGRVKRFLYTDTFGQQSELPADDIIHGFGVTTNGLTGLSPIQQARESLGAASARVRFEAESYGQRPYFSGVVQHPNTINDGGIKLRESWRAIYGSGGKDRHGVAVLEEGATFTPVNAPLADMQFVEASQLSKTQIAVLFKLPPAYIGGSTGDSLTYQTVEGNKIQKATQAVAPVANNIAQFLSHDSGIFPFPSWYCEFVLEGLLRGDSGARVTYWKAMHDMGVVDEKTIAAAENLPPPPAPKPVPQVLQPNPPANGTSAATDLQGIIQASA